MRLFKAAHTVYKTKISYCLDDPLSQENSGYWSKKLSENKIAGNQKILSGLGIYRDRYKARSYPFVYGLPSKYTVHQVVETIKKNTSRSLSKKFSFMEKVYWDRKGIWGKGYFVSTLGINAETIRKYVQSQEEEEAGQAEIEF